MYSYGNTEVVFPAALIEPKLSLKLGQSTLVASTSTSTASLMAMSKAFYKRLYKCLSRLSSAELNLLMDEFRIAILKQRRSSITRLAVVSSEQTVTYHR